MLENCEENRALRLRPHDLELVEKQRYEDRSDHNLRTEQQAKRKCAQFSGFSIIQYVHIFTREDQISVED